MPETPPDLQPLHALLTRRFAIIADHPWRDAEPDAHLGALADNAAAIAAWLDAHQHACPPQLRHFLTRSSLAKALDWIESTAGTPPPQCG